jgi:hypothetical protein
MTESRDVRLLLPDLLQGTQVPLFEMRLAAYNEIQRLMAENEQLRAKLKSAEREALDAYKAISLREGSNV